MQKRRATFGSRADSREQVEEEGEADEQSFWSCGDDATFSANCPAPGRAGGLLGGFWRAFADELIAILCCWLLVLLIPRQSHLYLIYHMRLLLFGFHPCFHHTSQLVLCRFFKNQNRPPLRFRLLTLVHMQIKKDKKSCQKRFLLYYTERDTSSSFTDQCLHLPFLAITG